MADDGKISVASDTQPSPGHAERAAAVALGPGTVLAGRYAIRATLGRGGMGVVLLAHDRVLREDVALKVLRPEYATERRWVDRLAREVRLARQIRHPNVCRVFDVESADGHTFIVMELASGGTLRAELDVGVARARPLAARLSDARAIAGGLAAIHDAGIVHRDVTPQNVLRMADGRLVVSDFGLAVGAGETTTSIQGGTVAYMSPEVARGGRASFESDVWSLGVVLHEVVFGEKPKWRSPTSFELVAPDLGRALTREEDAVLQACRACATADRGRRLQRAADVAARLAGRGGRWTRGWRRAFAYASLALAIAAAAAITVRRARHSNSSGAPLPFGTDTIVPTGQPADWTDVSKVLLTVNERIRCLVVLPEHHTVRLVWGTPRHAEDVDVTTGRHFASPLVPAAYHEGCPDVSPDGRRLLYQGYLDDGRAFAFVSPHPDGSDAKPVVATDDPSVLSDPRWLADGDSFVYDSDPQHAGVYSLTRNRTTILPQTTSVPATAFFRYAVGETVFLEVVEAGMAATDIRGLEWPWLSEGGHVRVAGLVVDSWSTRRDIFYASAPLDVPVADIIEVSLSKQQARRIGFLKGSQASLFSRVGDGGAVLVGTRLSNDVWVQGSDGQLEQITHLGDIVRAARCGPEFLVGRYRAGSRVIDRLASNGLVVEHVANGPNDTSPACSQAGLEWFFSKWTSGDRGTFRCTRQGCRRLLEEPHDGLDVSPDGSRLVYLELSKNGPRVRWISVDGGLPHEIADSESACSPGWSSPTTVWVSRRRGRQFIWTEVDADTMSPTGRVRPGTKGCYEGDLDPGSPVHQDLRVIDRRVAELRYLPADKLPP